MSIFEIKKNRFAIGTRNELATYVVQRKGKNWVGVRGRRPKLDERYTAVKKADPELRAALKAGNEG